MIDLDEMGKSLEIFVANPAGNITIFVKTPVSRSEYSNVAKKLLELDFDGKKGEQVAFITGSSSMEMCGLEFCGNASRSFGYYLAMHSMGNIHEVEVSVSGCDSPLRVHVDYDSGEASINMPLPVRVDKLFGGTLVEFEGIAHLILDKKEATEDGFKELRHMVYEDAGRNYEAFGVMYMDSRRDTMTPVVYVRDVDTIYFEGSCASGSAGAAVAMTMDKPDGEYDYSLRQPEGVLKVHVVKVSGEIKEVLLGGHIDITEPFVVNI